MNATAGLLEQMEEQVLPGRTARSAITMVTSGFWVASTTWLNVAGHRIGTMEVESAAGGPLGRPPRRPSWGARTT